MSCLINEKWVHDYRYYHWWELPIYLSPKVDILATKVTVGSDSIYITLQATIINTGKALIRAATKFHKARGGAGLGIPQVEVHLPKWDCGCLQAATGLSQTLGLVP